jgi:hypothetical protein
VPSPRSGLGDLWEVARGFGVIRKIADPAATTSPVAMPIGEKMRERSEGRRPSSLFPNPSTARRANIASVAACATSSPIWRRIKIAAVPAAPAATPVAPAISVAFVLQRRSLLLGTAGTPGALSGRFARFRFVRGLLSRILGIGSLVFHRTRMHRACRIARRPTDFARNLHSETSRGAIGVD